LFLARVDESAVRSAIDSLCDLLGVRSLLDRHFLDIGCGSGLSSLAARRLGAEVHSFDFDEQSVAAARALKERFEPGDGKWRIEQGSALDAEYMKKLGHRDVVYSWGVLHHTGAMWSAINLACGCVADHGQLVLAIYNDQGWQSRIWHIVKAAYVKLPVLRPLLIAVSAPVLWGPSLLRAAVRLRIRNWWTDYRSERGMSRWHDLIDWVGGYPFEVATPDAIIQYCEERGFRLERLITTTRLGCNQFAFRNDRAEPAATFDPT
jgi:2-polyprenyl-6-hydroxyphenyl methylase/3-demethylubiquinone-9 3-methyltransferase